MASAAGLRAACALAAATILLVPGPAGANPLGITNTIPLQLSEASVVDLGGAELLAGGYFTRDPYNSGGQNGWNGGPTIKLGILPRLQFKLGPSYEFGAQSSAQSGNVAAALKYNFNDQSTWFPALTLSGSYAVPYGAGYKSAQYTLVGIATKYLGPSKTSPRLDLNIGWTHVTLPAQGKRANSLYVGLAYAHLISSQTALVLETVHAERSAVGKNETFLGIGFTHEFNEHWEIGAGAGPGLGQQSPSFRVFLGVQRSFQLF